MQDPEQPLEIYLEGHVVFRQDEHGARGAVRVAQHQPAARYCGPVVRPEPGDRAALRERRA